MKTRKTLTTASRISNELYKKNPATGRFEEVAQ